MSNLVLDLDQILENGDGVVVLSNSGFIIVWDGKSHFRVWNRRNDERFSMGASFPGLTFGKEEVARGLASTYALKLLR